MSRFTDLQDGTERRLIDAAAWRLRLTEDGATSSPEFEAWLREPANQAAWNQVSGPWAFFDEVAHAPEMVAARQKALEDAKHTGGQLNRPALIRKLTGAIAAALLIGVMGTASHWWLTQPGRLSHRRGRAPGHHPVRRLEIVARRQQRSDRALPSACPSFAPARKARHALTWRMTSRVPSPSSRATRK